MSIRTFLLFLIGNRKAILTLASDRRALWVGLLFVLSAGFAREYDAHSLWHEPWFFFIPLLASLISSFVLFRTLFPVKPARQWRDSPQPTFLFAYVRFLTLFWMTAPLAWLYAVPYERFMTSTSAALTNMLTLAVVAAWRVALMVRVATVLLGYSPLGAFFRVMFFATILAVVGSFAMTLAAQGPLVFAMSGIHHTPGDPLILSLGSAVTCWGAFLIPVWFIGMSLTIPNADEGWRGPLSRAELSASRGLGMWLLGAGSIAVWVLILPRTQPEQELRWRVESELRSGRIAEALDTMSAHEPGDFPPCWEPPIIISTKRFKPHILDVLDEIVVKPPAPWVREHFLGKFGTYLECCGVLPARDQDDAMDAAQYLLKLPEGEALAAEHQDRIRQTMYPPHFLPEDRAKLETLLERVKGSRP